MEQEIKIKQKRRIVLLVMSISALIITVVGATYAYFTAGIANETTETISVKAGKLTINYNNGKNINISNTLPQDGALDTKVFTVVGNNNTNTTMPYFIELHVTENGFSEEAIKYTMTSGNISGNGTAAPSIETKAGLPSGDGVYQLGEAEFVMGEGQAHSYTISLYFPNDPDKNQNIDQGKTIKAYIAISGEALVTDKLLADAIKDANPLKTGADFNKTSPYITTYNDPTEWISPGTTPITQTYWIGTDYTYNAATGNYTLSGTLTQGLDSGNIKTGQYTIRNTTNTASAATIYRIESYVSGNAGATITVNKVQKSGTSAPNYSTESGLYSAPDDYGTSYYYRGVVNNNNVIFGGYQWKIIRIDGRGNIKLIYNGTEAQFNTAGTVNTTGADTQLDDTAFNTNYNDNKYVGYIVDGGPSTIKTAVDTFYAGLSSEAKDKIVDSIYCNDLTFVSGTGTGTTNTNYGAYDRLNTKKTPTFICPESAGKLTLPIGLITADEVAYAGGKSGSSNNAYYLYNASYYWTMSPGHFNGYSAYAWSVGSNGNLNNNNVSGGSGARPSITLSSEIRVTGTGSSTDPYKVV